MARTRRSELSKTIEAIRAETDAVLEGLGKDAHGEMILIHRTKYRDLEKKFRLLPVEIYDDLKAAFEEGARSALEGIMDNAESMTDFSDPANAKSYVAMDGSLLPDLGVLLKKLEEETSLHGSHDFDEVREKGISCFVIKLPDQRRAFMLFNVGKNHLNPDKHIVTKLVKGGLRLHTDRLVIFENRAFAVYYEDIKKLLMISYRQTKKLLNFDERFRAKCRSILDDGMGGLVTLDDAETDVILGDRSVNEKMVKMESRGTLAGADRGLFTAWNEFYETTPLEGTGRIRLDGGGRAIVKKPSDLEMLLRVLNGDIVEVVISRGRYALATGKKELEVTQRDGPRLSRQSAQPASYTATLN